MLNKLKIKGLRGFAEEREFLPAVPNGSPGSGLTVITGPNNAGKSTVVEALGARRPNGNPSFNVGMRNRKFDSVELSYEFDNHSESIKSVRKGSSETNSQDVKFEDGKIYVVPSRRYFAPYFSKQGGGDRDTFRRNYSGHNQFRSQQMVYFEGRLFQIENDQVQFNSVIKKVIPELLEWSIDQNENDQYFLKFQSSDRSHSSAGVGDGIISAFVITTALYDSHPGETIVIDEPELSLNPSVQKRLSALLEDFSKDRQIIVATHSPYFVRPQSLLNGARVYRCWDRNGAIHLFFADQSKDCGLAQLLTDDKNKPHLFGLDAREIFFTDDGVLILEGQEDVVFWPIALGSSDAINYSVFGWGAGGASNVQAVLSLLQCLGFEKVAAVFDNDVPEALEAATGTFPLYKILNIPAADIRTKKSVKAREKKDGLLNDGNDAVRAELQDEFDEVRAEIDSYMATKEAVTAEPEA